LHKDARCELQNRQVVGSDADDDIVLSDAGIGPHAAIVRFTDSGWYLDVEGSEEKSELRSWNEPAALGAAWITVAPTDAPWVSVPSHEEGRAGTGESNQGDYGATPLHSHLEVNEMSMLEGGDFKPAGSGLNARRGRTRLRGMVVLGCALAIGLLLAVLLGAFILVPNHSANRDTHGATRDQMALQIKAVLERLGLRNFEVDWSPNGVATVKGWVPDGVARDRLAQALAQFWPIPAMQVSIESDVVATARLALQSFPVKYDVQYRGAGGLEINGIALSEKDLDAALDAVRGQVPGMNVVNAGIKLAPDVSDSLAKTCLDAGLPDIKLSWKDNHLNVQPPPLESVEKERLASIVMTFNRENWGVARLRPPNPATVAHTVPFAIRSVIGGPQPVVVLADGSKLLVGGWYQKYQLVAVEPTQIVFDGVRRAVIPR
jgi:type III secretion protein D